MIRVLVLAIALTATVSFAQEDQEELKGEFPRKYSEFGMVGGAFLPFGIFGVRNDYPAWWLRYGHNLASWRVDWTFNHVNSEGVTWYTAGVAVGGIMDMYDTLRVAFGIGFAFHYYKPAPTNIRELSWTRSQGMFVSASPMIPIGGPVFLRSDFQMNFGPGQSLFAGLGFSYLF